jgi:PBSX family phage terminase large subunit
MERKKHLHYWFKGGRGSLKSSYVHLYTIFDLTRDFLQGKNTHALGLRKVKDTIKDSVFTNFLWAIDMLGLNDIWHYTTNPMRIYTGTSKNPQNTILFRGAANQGDYQKIKSIKFKKGYCKHIIFEELTEFVGMDEIRSINQSLLRGGDEAIVNYMYNPPASISSWVNDQVREFKKLERQSIDTKTRIHHSTYLEAPPEWLGESFINEAELIKKINPKKYRHMYLGEETGEGLEIYPEYDPRTKTGVLTLREITDEEISKFSQIQRGVDLGYSHASCYSESFYDKSNQKLYIFDEVYLYHASNWLLFTKIKQKSKNFLIWVDNEDPRTIKEMQKFGLNAIKTKKGPDSKNHGIKWVQDRAEIIIDPKRCPNLAVDFKTYEYEKDKKTDKIIYEYPDEPDGSASVRYGQEKNIRADTWKVS